MKSFVLVNIIFYSPKLILILYTSKITFVSLNIHKNDLSGPKNSMPNIGIPSIFDHNILKAEPNSKIIYHSIELEIFGITSKKNI